MPSKTTKKKTVRKKPIKRAPKKLIPKAYQDQFDKLPEPIRSKAMRNYDFSHDGDGVDSIEYAIASAFYWSSTPEGRDYWQSVSIGDYSVEPECKPIKFKCSIPEDLCRHSEGPEESFESRLDDMNREIQKEKEWLEGIEIRLAELSRTVDAMLRPWWKFWA